MTDTETPAAIDAASASKQSLNDGTNCAFGTRNYEVIMSNSLNPLFYSWSKQTVLNSAAI